MKKFLFIVLSFTFLTSCSNDNDLYITSEDSLFSLTKENALISCGGKSQIIENEGEEIIKIEIKSSNNEEDKFVQFTVVEIDKKGGRYRIINCYPSAIPEDSIIKTIKTNYKLNE